MQEQPVERKLVAILVADMAGYSRLVGLDEEGTLARLRALRSELIDPTVAEHRGRIVKTIGDGILVEFASVVDAVRCAVAVQRATAVREAVQPHECRIEFRVGINVGDVVVDGEDILGDGVNIAARLESISEPGGICVSDDAFHQARGKVEVDFADIGEKELKNIVRPVRAYRVVFDKPVIAQPAALPLPDKPSIAVLPFRNMSGDPEQEYFADGMVEEIITALSRIRWLFVIARNSSFAYKGEAIDVKRVGRELGVRYVLEGSVRKGGGRVRITAQLIDAETGAHLWADRFDGSLEDVFDLQDQVASSVAGVIEPALQAAETARSAGRPTNDLNAYDLYLRAFDMVWRSAGQLHKALSLMEQAIERDPRYGPALGWAAHCYARLLSAGRSEDPDADRRKGINFARRALEAAGDDPGVLVSAAFALDYFGEDNGAMIALIDRALALNPNYARAWVVSGNLRVRGGQPEIAVEHLENALRLSPRTRVSGALSAMGRALFCSRRFDEAMSKLLFAIQEDPENVPPYRFLAACYAHLGRLDEAREVVTRLRAITTVVIPDGNFLRNPEHRELFLSGLRLAAEAAG